jgi:hypothetical protein
MDFNDKLKGGVEFLRKDDATLKLYILTPILGKG